MDEFVKLIEEFGEPELHEAVSDEDAKSYKGRVPDRLIEFWREHGRGCFQRGKDWVCDPAPFAPVVEAVFKGDPDFRVNDLVVIKRTAFAELTLWGHNLSGPVTINFNSGEVSAFGQTGWIDRKSGRRHSPDFIVGALFYRAKFVESWVTDDDEDMLPLAIDSCGLLHSDELYGFFPALQTGGGNDVAYVRRVKAVEHLLFLTEITNFNLIRMDFPDPNNPGGYHRQVVRRIGTQNSPN